MSANAAELVRQHPPLLRNENKQVLFAIASPAGAVHSGRIEYSRWPRSRSGLPARSTLAGAAWPSFATGRDRLPPCPRPGRRRRVARQLRRSNLFYAYGSALFAQDEIQVAEHPVLGSLREALVAEGQPTTTIANGRPTPVLVMGAERRVLRDRPGTESGGPSWLYGMAFARATADAVRQAMRHVSIRPTISNIIAIVAPYGGRGRYQREQIGLAYDTAYSRFRPRFLSRGEQPVRMPWSPFTPASGDAGRSAATGSA